MSRFRLTQAISTAQVRFHAGEVVTDQIPLNVPTDEYWPGLSASTMAPGMNPLDRAATSMKANHAFAGAVIHCTITGADSVGG